jgi:hypothetical protein
MAVPPNVQFDGISFINYYQIRGTSVPVTPGLVWWQLNGLRWAPMYDEICVLTVNELWQQEQAADESKAKSK